VNAGFPAGAWDMGRRGNAAFETKVTVGTKMIKERLGGLGV